MVGLTIKRLQLLLAIHTFAFCMNRMVTHSFIFQRPPSLRKPHPITDPDVRYASPPPPPFMLSPNLITKRIDHLSSLTALITALSDLDALCGAIEDRYVENLAAGGYEKWQEKS